MREYRPQTASPWSFFPPVALAVLVGGLAAGLLLRSIDAALRSDDPVVAVDAVDAVVPVAIVPPADPDTRAPAPPDAPPERARAAPMQADGAGGLPAPAESAGVGTPVVAAAIAPAFEPAAPVPELPGALAARREGASEACINGTVARRDPHGWQQRLENDAPVACIERAVAP